MIKAIELTPEKLPFLVGGAVAVLAGMFLESCRRRNVAPTKRQAARWLRENAATVERMTNARVA